MTNDSALAPFSALIGTWESEATHPMLDAVVPGSVEFELLENGHFLVQRSHHDHELFPDSISVLGVPERGDGLVMEYFDSRGVRRTYGVAIEEGVWRSWRDAPGFDQRFSATLAADRFVGRWQVAERPGAWQDDVVVVYRRRGERPVAGGQRPTRELFAGLRVRDLAEARAWYERLLGEPSFLPNDVEAVWSLAEGQALYVVQDPDRAGRGLVTVWGGDELDALLTTIAGRGVEPDRWERYGSGVRKAVFVDHDGNEVGFAGPG